MKDYDDRAVEKIAISISILYIHIHSCFCTGTEYARYEEMVVTFGSYSTAGTRGLPLCEILSRFARAGCVSVQSVSPGSVRLSTSAVVLVLYKSPKRKGFVTCVFTYVRHHTHTQPRTLPQRITIQSPFPFYRVALRTRKHIFIANKFIGLSVGRSSVFSRFIVVS